MDWRDEGILLRVRRHGESSAIIEVLTEGHGRHAGLVRGGASKTRAAMLQPGAHLSVEWSARLSEHLGTYRADLIRSHAGAIMADRARLACLNALSALLVEFLAEREPCEALYAGTRDLVEALAAGDPGWPARYALWEQGLMEVLGFGLDLSACAATGGTEDLAFVSPKTGRAVSRAAGAPYEGRLLDLPAFLIGQGPEGPGEVAAALSLSGWFLRHWVCPAFDRQDLPAARDRLVRLIEADAEAASGDTTPAPAPRA